jgi:hypothetical protein
MYRIVSATAAAACLSACVLSPDMTAVVVDSQVALYLGGAIATTVAATKILAILGIL